MQFLKNPGRYNFFRSVLFLGAAASTFYFESIPWFVGLIVLAIFWAIAGSVGRKKAYKAYREIVSSLIDPEGSEEDNESYKIASEKTDDELSGMVQIAMKNGI
ncbi:MAG: hypothetical protein GY705_02195 [Bacteroidetes bacterium]|nr:hypothetical protein [Bacteroidota bacterium]